MSRNKSYPKHSLVQSVLFDRKYWDIQTASEWLREHDLKSHFDGKKVDVTNNYFRFRQHTPMKKLRYRTIKTKDHISFIVGFFPNPS